MTITDLDTKAIQSLAGFLRDTREQDVAGERFANESVRSSNARCGLAICASSNSSGISKTSPRKKNVSTRLVR